MKLNVNFVKLVYTFYVQENMIII